MLESQSRGAWGLDRAAAPGGVGRLHGLGHSRAATLGASGGATLMKGCGAWGLGRAAALEA
jgi:hypothetical protein